VDSVRGLLLLGELVVPLRLVQQACQGASAVAADDVVGGAVADHQDLGGADAPDTALSPTHPEELVFGFKEFSNWYRLMKCTYVWHRSRFL
jgi:hypothetical protein